jgi:hypothetical protein
MRPTICQNGNCFEKIKTKLTFDRRQKYQKFLTKKNSKNSEFLSFRFNNSIHQKIFIENETISLD